MIEMDPDRHPVETLAEQFAERCRRGERPSVDEYARQYPEHAEQIRALFPSIGLMEQMRHNDHAEREQLDRRDKFRAAAGAHRRI